MTRLDAFAAAREASPSRSVRWLGALGEGLGHRVFCVEAARGGQTAGILPLVFVRSLLFGRFLVSLPYLNVGGAIADEESVAVAMVDRAVALADELDVKRLELRHEVAIAHPALGHTLDTKVHMRLDLPGSSEALWESFDPKVRNQIRKGEKHDFEVVWGREPLLDDFYDVFAQNMRDLGTPVFGWRLFERILAHFPDEAELCVLRREGRAAAGAILVHGPGMTEVPSASSLRAASATNANMLMYWHLLGRTIERGRPVFDFGRSTVGSGTYRFKKQWGARPHPAVWQYHVRAGSVDALRLESGKFDLAVQVWRRLPVWLTRRLGPRIVRGIP
ncbi:MAG: FemAB family PEP-CTERM system-associated protein [Pirellulales bacterium]|nr:FemAB family PEP-CTERM system-associated protein [Pirellulales bacterium]